MKKTDTIKQANINKDIHSENMLVVDFPKRFRTLAADNDWTSKTFKRLTGHVLLSIKLGKMTNEEHGDRPKELLDFGGLCKTPGVLGHKKLELNLPVMDVRDNNFVNVHKRLCKEFPSVIHIAKGVDIMHFKTQYKKRVFSWKRLPIPVENFSNGRQMYDQKLILTSVNGRDSSTALTSSDTEYLEKMVGKFVNSTLCTIVPSWKRELNCGGNNQ